MVEHTGGIVAAERLHVMDPRQLKALKDKTKVLEAYPDFAPGSRSKDFPKPLKQLRRYDMVSDLITVADHHVIAFAVRRRELQIDCKFYGYWGLKTDENKLLPIMIMHYHPDHKGIHILVPCNTDPQRDFTSRELPGAPELNLYPGIAPDIRTDEGVCKLIELFCQAAGITISGKWFVQGSLF